MSRGWTLSDIFTLLTSIESNVALTQGFLTQLSLVRCLMMDLEHWDKELLTMTTLTCFPSRAGVPTGTTVAGICLEVFTSATTVGLA